MQFLRAIRILSKILHNLLFSYLNESVFESKITPIYYDDTIITVNVSKVDPYNCILVIKGNVYVFSIIP